MQKMAKIIIGIVFVYGLFSLLTGFELSRVAEYLPGSHATARAAAFLLLIMTMIFSVVELGWGGGTRDK